MLYTIVFALIALHCVSTIQTASRPFNLELQPFNCSKYSARVKRFDCDLTNVAPSRYALNLNFILDTELDKDAEVRVMIDFRYKKGGKVVRFIDLKLKMCDLLSQLQAVPLMRDILTEVRRTSNMPYSCPIRANILYKLTNYTITAATLPTYTPIINFNFSIGFYENQKLVGSLLLEGTTVPK